MSVKWRSMFIFIHHTAICPGTICWADYLFPSDCHWHPFQDQLTINMKIYFQTRQSPPPTHPYFSHAIGIAGFTVSSSRGKWDLSNLVQICTNDSGYCADKMISVCCFQDSLSLVVCAAMCLGVNLFELPLLGISWASWMCWKVVFHQIWDMFYCCFKYSFCPFQLSLFLKYQLCLCWCVCVHGIPRMLRLLLLFYILFCFSSDCIVSDDLLGGCLTASSSFPGMKVCSKWVDLSQFK